jgi:hypothetical protein
VVRDDRGVFALLADGAEHSIGEGCIRVTLPYSRTLALWFWEWEEPVTWLAPGQSMPGIVVRVRQTALEVAGLLEKFEWDKARQESRELRRLAEALR